MIFSDENVFYCHISYRTKKNQRNYFGNIVEREGMLQGIAPLPTIFSTSFNICMFLLRQICPFLCNLWCQIQEYHSVRAVHRVILQVDSLEKRRLEILNMKASVIQGAWRKFINRRLLKKKAQEKLAASTIQKRWRCYVKSKRLKAVLVLQKSGYHYHLYLTCILNYVSQQNFLHVQIQALAQNKINTAHTMKVSCQKYWLHQHFLFFPTIFVLRSFSWSH